MVAWIVKARSSHSVDGMFERSVVRIPLKAEYMDELEGIWCKMAKSEISMKVAKKLLFV